MHDIIYYIIIGGIIMCGRYLFFGVENTEEIRNILSELSKKYTSEEISNIKTGEIFPTDNVPILVNKNNKRSFELFRWGFKNFKSKNVIINARCETLKERKMFKPLINTRRCLIPATGFFEWDHKNGSKDKFLIWPSKKRFFYMAGLYNIFRIDNIYLTSFVIITTDANKEMARIHNRMPVILKENFEDEWLFSKNIDIDKILKPYDDKLAFEKV